MWVTGPGSIVLTRPVSIVWLAVLVLQCITPTNCVDGINSTSTVPITSVVPHKEGEGQTDQNFILYTDIRPANGTDSLERIRNCPLVHYRFVYDNVPNRTQLGIIGPDAQKWFPESIDVLPSKIFANKDRTKEPVILTNFPIVDKNVLFMHGAIATKELIIMYEDLLKQVEQYSKDKLEQLIDIERKTMELEFNISAQEMEMITLKIERAEKDAKLSAIQAENERLIIEQQLENQKIIMQLEEELARERFALQEKLAREHGETLIQLEKELGEEREKLRRQTSEKLLLLSQEQEKEMEKYRLAFEEEKAIREIELQGEQQRANEEMEIKRINAQSKADVEKMIQNFRLVVQQISFVLSSIFLHPVRVLVICSVLLGIMVFYHFVKELAVMLRQYIQNSLGKPLLVRETSVQRVFLPKWLASTYLFRESQEPLSSTLKSLQNDFEDIILHEEDKSRVLSLALAIRNTKQTTAPFRHVLLHGPPGTGKTLIARRLAQCSKMDYAVMSGGDVAPLGEDAVNQLHGLFQWAARSRNGLIVFIDEAEAFLSARTASQGGETESHVRNALNAMLYQTGSPSKSFMLILATNRPEDLDAAVMDRMDVSLHIGKPGHTERVELCKLYMSLNVSRVAASILEERSWLVALFKKRKPKHSVEEACSASETMQVIATATEDFSGREISKMFIAVQYAMLLSHDGLLTKKLLMETVEKKVQDHALKVNGFTMRSASKPAVGSFVENIVGKSRKEKVTASKSKIAHDAKEDDDPKPLGAREKESTSTKRRVRGN